MVGPAEPQLLLAPLQDPGTPLGATTELTASGGAGQGTGLHLQASRQQAVETSPAP